MTRDSEHNTCKVHVVHFYFEYFFKRISIEKMEFNQTFNLC